jgi:hypothetical protein
MARAFPPRMFTALSMATFEVWAVLALVGWHNLG